MRGAARAAWGGHWKSAPAGATWTTTSSYVSSAGAPEDIDAVDGEAALHVEEAAALRHALAEPPPVIVGAAAWVIADPDSVALLRAQPAVVYLRAHPDALRQRIGSGHGRRRDATDLAWLQERSGERDHLYRELAALTIDTDALEPADVADHILARLGLTDPTADPGKRDQAFTGA